MSYYTNLVESLAASRKSNIKSIYFDCGTTLQSPGQISSLPSSSILLAVDLENSEKFIRSVSSFAYEFEQSSDPGCWKLSNG